jgi:DnaJ-class molecular chaperone
MPNDPPIVNKDSEPCDLCHGSGQTSYGPQTGADQPSKECSQCGGSGSGDNNYDSQED